MHHKQFFWLHIKKSAGMMTRSLLQPYYVGVDRTRKPITFIQAQPEQYNDILNNYRVVLGEYQFRRCLFAKKYLYPTSWGNIYSFAFSREPTDRCISMFHYLYWEEAWYKNLLHSLKRKFRTGQKLEFNTAYAFDVFLDYIQEARLSNSIYHPLSHHFTTHTAPMWDDITDNEGSILLTKVFRLEALTEGINEVFNECSIDNRVESPTQKLNMSKRGKKYSPNRTQIKKIEQIYAKDFEIYETAWPGNT
ncbi:MAG: sulfotransferase family 2 domain-containing protein [Chloroflexota bacterium]